MFCLVVSLTRNRIKKGDVSSLLLLDEVQVDLVPDVRDQWEVWIWINNRTVGHEGLPGLEASVALLDEVLGHPVGPGGGQAELGGLVVLPHPRAGTDSYELGRTVTRL